ncbi:MAG TPA: hypothetical protein VD994_03750, partial [Prosthecobacter sp.]|nr:hypothetical protein [Prosthecobacter sp.]
MFRHLSPSWPAALAASLLIPSLCSAQAPAAGLDISFGAGGKSIATLPGYTTQTFGIDRQADGKFITVGQAWAGGTTYRMALTRLNADGTLDTSFGVNGFVVYGPSSGLTYAARCLKVLADGKILVAGDASGSVVVVRFLATGALDSSFTVTSTFVGTNAQVTAMAVLSDGRCLVAANALRSGNSDNDGHVLRFTASGNVDSSFASSGRFTYGGSGEQTVAGVVVLPDGKILHAGTANGQDMYVARLTPAGSMDTTFRSTGRTLISAASGSTVEGARALCLDADGNIVVVGQSNPGAANDILVARLTSTGFLDTVFSGDGWLLTNLGGTSGLPTGLAVQADGQILISGHRPFGSPTGIALRRLLWTGDDDTSFDSDGLLTAAVGSSTSDTAGMVLEPAGGIVVAGSALESGFLRGFAAARFLPGPSLAGVEITITQDLADQTAPLATPVTLSVVASSSVPLIYSWYQNGILQVRNTSPNYGFNKVSVVNEGTWRVEVRHASSAVWSSAVTLKVLSPPVLTGQSDREVHAVIGGSAQFSANFSGRAPFTCTWFEGDTEVQSATSGLFSSTLAFSPVAAAQEGTYKLVVANADGTATSQDYILVARPDPFVDQMNPGYLVEMGGSEQLNAWAYASGDYRLQWYKNGAAITNARQSGYRIEPAALSHAGNYTLSLRSLKGSAVSTVVKVAVLNTAPVTH